MVPLTVTPTLTPTVTHTVALPTHPFIDLPAISSAPCLDGETTCQHIYDWTGNRQLANLADLVIGKPTALLVIVLVGLLVRWLLHRAVDRLVSRAEHGVLPDRLSRMTVGRSTTETGESASTR